MSKKKDAIDEEAPVTAHIYGDTIEMSTAIGGIPVMQKINKDEMVNTHTGEITEIHHITSRADPQNYRSLKSTFKRLKRLIGTNFHGGHSELWITLTYKDSPMKDPDRLYKDFKRMMRRLRRMSGKYLAYIVVIEPQASGSLHAHLLLKNIDGSRLYIANKDLRKAWGQGFVNVKRLSDADNVSSYVMAYVSNVDLNNLEGKFEENNAPKRIVKGGRLALYPVGMQLYRRSRRGSKEPVKLKGSKKLIKEKYNISNAKPDYYHKFDIQRETGEDPFEIETEYYSRRKAQLAAAIAKINRSCQ
ncbi:rolling circle replication-associated protein, partial [Lactobacillus helveticus]|uniref:rolling circle replication-associated protein n=1 Tax=Lactobacillus helveticus TaxID=1587 RepID=UPI001561B4A0